MDITERYKQSWLAAEAHETQLIKQVHELQEEVKRLRDELADLRGDGFPEEE